MALIKCRECGREISDQSSQCIHCGCPVNNGVQVGSNSVLNTIENNNVINTGVSNIENNNMNNNVVNTMVNSNLNNEVNTVNSNLDINVVNKDSNNIMNNNVVMNSVSTDNNFMNSNIDITNNAVLNNSDVTSNLDNNNSSSNINSEVNNDFSNNNLNKDEKKGNKLLNVIRYFLGVFCLFFISATAGIGILAVILAVLMIFPISSIFIYSKINIPKFLRILLPIVLMIISIVVSPSFQEGFNNGMNETNDLGGSEYSDDNENNLNNESDSNVSNENNSVDNNSDNQNAVEDTTESDDKINITNVEGIGKTYNYFNGYNKCKLENFEIVETGVLFYMDSVYIDYKAKMTLLSNTNKDHKGCGIAIKVYNDSNELVDTDYLFFENIDFNEVGVRTGTIYVNLATDTNYHLKIVEDK